MDIPFFAGDLSRGTPARQVKIAETQALAVPAIGIGLIALAVGQQRT